MSNNQINYVSPERLRPYPGNARSHSRTQIKLIAKSIKRFDFINLIVVTDDFEVVAGHGRLEAAKSLGMQLVPIVTLSSLSEADIKAIRTADNRIAELSNWDPDILAIEYQGLRNLQFDDIEVTGFSMGDIDFILDEASGKKPGGLDTKNDFPPVVAAPVSRKGDLWIFDPHRPLCGDACCDKPITSSMKPFDFINPILLTDDFKVVPGHGRFQAARLLGKQVNRSSPSVRSKKLN
jgi:ParB-like chromosome segregation protein Spo0J